MLIYLKLLNKDSLIEQGHTWIQGTMQMVWPFLHYNCQFHCHCQPATVSVITITIIIIIIIIIDKPDNSTKLYPHLASDNK